MLSLREGQSPTKQSIQKSGLPRILTNARNDIAGQGGILTRLMAVCNDRSVGRSERAGLNSHKALSPYQLIALTPLAKAAFTMAEILLSLTIIGVVAAITLPSLTGNINERTWNTQRKALYSRLSQAISLMPSIRGYGPLIGSPNPDHGYQVYCASNAAEVFLANGLGKVMKINNICSGTNLSDCGLPNEYVRYGGSGKIALSELYNIQQLHSLFKGGGCGMTDGVDSQAAAFETVNGESLLVHYNPVCKNDDQALGSNSYSLYPTVSLCVNFIYDLNGKKGPNTMGKDVGIMSVMYPSDSVIVAPLPMAKNAGQTSWNNAAKLCTSQDADARVPNREELMALVVNRKFMDDTFQNTDGFWSSSARNSTAAWTYYGTGDYHVFEWYPKTQSRNVRCIKRFNS